MNSISVLYVDCIVVICSIYLCSCLLENDDDAIAILANHFHGVIAAIKENKWTHFMAARQVERKGPRVVLQPPRSGKWALSEVQCHSCYNDIDVRLHYMLSG